MENQTIGQLEQQFIKLSKEIISTLEQAKKNTAEKMAVRRLLIERDAYSPKKLDKVIC